MIQNHAQLLLYSNTESKLSFIYKVSTYLRPQGLKLKFYGCYPRRHRYRFQYHSSPSPFFRWWSWSSLVRPYVAVVTGATSSRHHVTLPSPLAGPPIRRKCMTAALEFLLKPNLSLLFIVVRLGSSLYYGHQHHIYPAFNCIGDGR